MQSKSQRFKVYLMPFTACVVFYGPRRFPYFVHRFRCESCYFSRIYRI